MAMAEEARVPTGPRRVRFALKGGEMAGIEFGPVDRPVEILFLHATGLNARTYATLLAPLADKFRVLAVDFRGHGQTTLPAGRWFYGSWDRHAQDVSDLIGEHLKSPVVLAGHSMGAITALLVAGRRPDMVRGLALLEPVLLAPSVYTLTRLPGMVAWNRLTSPMSRGALRRKATFASRDEMTEALTGRGFFKTWPPDMLADYVEDGAVETETGVRLACDRRYEAATFAAQRHDPWSALARAPNPFVLLRAEKGSTCSPASVARLQALRPDVRVATLEGATHALPMERPDRCRAAIETAAVMRGRQAQFHDVV